MNAIHIELWQLLSALGACALLFLGFVFGAGKMLLSQIERRLDERFQAQEKERQEATKHWDARFKAMESNTREELAEWQRIDRDLLKLQADLPMKFVLREDYIRGQSVIEAKLDALYNKLEVVQLQGAGK